MTKKIQDKVVYCQDFQAGSRKKKAIAKVKKAQFQEDYASSSNDEVSGSDTISDGASDNSMQDERSSPDFKSQRNPPRRNKKVSKLLGRSVEGEENSTNHMDVCAGQLNERVGSKLEFIAQMMILLNKQDNKALHAVLL